MSNKTRPPTVSEAAAYIKKINSKEQEIVQMWSWKEKLGDDFVNRVRSELNKGN